MNHGIFLCENCATGIHINHYPVQVSFIKKIKGSHFNYLQLRVLIDGGNKAALDFFEVYDLQNEPVQKRYNTVAAQFYRDKIRNMHETSLISFGSDQRKVPSLEEGRSALKSDKKLSEQVRPFS